MSAVVCRCMCSAPESFNGQNQLGKFLSGLREKIIQIGSEDGPGITIFKLEDRPEDQSKSVNRGMFQKGHRNSLKDHSMNRGKITPESCCHTQIAGGKDSPRDRFTKKPAGFISLCLHCRNYLLNFSLIFNFVFFRSFSSHFPPHVRYCAFDWTQCSDSCR